MSQAARDHEIVEYLDHPKLKPFTRRIPAGQYLFRQGDVGNTMYIICDGIVWLIAERGADQHVAAVLERGQFLGEKAVMGSSDHSRFFSALAKTSTTAIQMELKDIDAIQRDVPELMIDMLRKMFHVAAGRLDRSNYLIRVLRSSDNVERLVELILYFSQSSGRKVPEGTEFLLTEDSIHYHTDMTKSAIEFCITALVNMKLIRPVVNQYYTIKDPKALREAIPVVREMLRREGAPKTPTAGGGIFSKFLKR